VGKVGQTIYTHVGKCKNDKNKRREEKIKGELWSYPF
jgi:hypothetical protein